MDRMYSGRGSRVVTPARPSKYKPPSDKKESYVDFSEHSTTHGLYYVFERDAKHVSHCFWLLICLALMVLAVYLIALQYINWRNDPVLTTVSTTGYPVFKLSYPAITICSLGMVEEVMVSALKHMIMVYGEEKGVTDLDDTKENGELINDLADKGHYFLHEKFPGTTLDVQEMVTAMASKNPEQYIESTVAIDGGWNSCDNFADSEEGSGSAAGTSGSGSGSTTSTTPTCPSGATLVTATLDGESESQCFATSLNRVGYDAARAWCDQTYYGDIVEFIDDVQIQAVIDVIKAGSNLTDLATGRRFWALLDKDDDGNFVLSDGYPLSALGLTKLTVTAPKKFSKQCATYSYNSTSEKFVVEESDCWDDQRSQFCSIYPTVQEDCSATSSTRKKRQSDGPSENLENVLNPTKKYTFAASQSQAKKAFRESFASVNFTSSYRNFFELLWYSQLPCFDVDGITAEKNGQRSLLKKCYWKGLKLDCASIFTLFPTDRGICCTFNMHTADEIFMEGQYRDMIEEMQARDKNMSFGSSDPPAWYVQLDEPQSHQGVRKGLTIVLDAHSDQLASSSVGEDFNGFIAMVNNRESYPLSSLKQLKIRPGHENLVALTAVDVKADSDLKDEDVSDRQCYFQDEHALKMHNKYSQASCILECQIGHALSKMGNESACVPWYLPVAEEDAYPMCDPWGAVTFRAWMENVTTECDVCLPDCAGTIYESTVTAAPFRKCSNQNLGVSKMCNLEDSDALNPPLYGDQVLLEYEKENPTPTYIDGKYGTSIRQYSPDKSKEVFVKTFAEDSPLSTYDAFDRDIAVATFYFESPVVFQYKRQKRMSGTDFLSQVGGLLGLCLGFSFCSGVEVIYWFLIRLPIGCKKKAKD